MKKDLNESKRIDTILKLYEFQTQFFFKRRDIVWKINISFWTAIIIVTGGLLKLEMKFQSSECWIYVIYFIVFVLYSFWNVVVYLSDEKDKHYLKIYRDEVETLVNIKSRKKFCIVNTGIWWQIATSLITVILLLISLVIISNR